MIMCFKNILKIKRYNDADFIYIKQNRIGIELEPQHLYALDKVEEKTFEHFKTKNSVTYISKYHLTPILVLGTLLM